MAGRQLRRPARRSVPLNLTDRTLIYHYTDRGFTGINNALHALTGAQVPISQWLNAAA